MTQLAHKALPVMSTLLVSACRAYLPLAICISVVCLALLLASGMSPQH
jgi:hypothetical protein